MPEHQGLNETTSILKQNSTPVLVIEGVGGLLFGVTAYNRFDGALDSALAAGISTNQANTYHDPREAVAAERSSYSEYFDAQVQTIEGVAATLLSGALLVSTIRSVIRRKRAASIALRTKQTEAVSNEVPLTPA